MILLNIVKSVSNYNLPANSLLFSLHDKVRLYINSSGGHVLESLTANFNMDHKCENPHRDDPGF